AVEVAEAADTGQLVRRSVEVSGRRQLLPGTLSLTGEEGIEQLSWGAPEGMETLRSWVKTLWQCSSP
ncbi:hypothetical protein, partial [Streptomyces sp. MZ04]|uniref:hypothetical protein n=1 Tax=Streptomyces sp. MZ04 TaxID=2559236 RepID=UPI001AE0D697